MIKQDELEQSRPLRLQRDLNSGLIALVLLAVLNDADRDLYAYEIGRLLREAGGGRSRFSDGAIYPVLRTLARDGLLASRIVPSYSGPPRRYYRITDEGRRVMPQWQRTWRETCAFVDHFVAAASPA